MLNIFNKNKIVMPVLIIIFILALFLRTVKLSEYPAGFQIDEAILGYTGYSIIHTLKDTNGVFLPMYTEVFGDYIPTGYHYLTIPSILVFGLTEFATRFPGALFGALMVFPIFFLTFSLFKNKKAALFSSLFMAISPWSITLSRGSSEALVSVLFVVSGFAFIFHSFRSKKIYPLVSGSVLLIFSFFFYHTPRLFIPLMLISIIVFLIPQRKSFSKNYRGAFLTVSLVMVLIVAALMLSFKGSTARFDQISIFSYPEVRLVMEEQIREDGLQKPFITRVFHNKIVNSSFAFAQNYSEYLSIDNLFLKPGLPRMFTVPNSGLIFAVFIPFFFYGLLRIFIEKDRIARLAIIWILIAPITAALTVDDVPNMRRASILYPMIEIVSVYGLISFLIFIKKYNKILSRTMYLVLLLIFIWSFSYFLHQYFVHGKKHQPWYRNNGFGEVMQIVNDNYSKYEKIVMTKTGGGYPLVLFYSRFNPADYISEGSPKDKDFKGFGKYMFIPSECPSGSRIEKLQRYSKVLFVDRGTCKEPSPKSGKKFKNIYRDDGSLGFRIIY